MDAVVIVLVTLALATVGGYIGGVMGWREARRERFRWHWPKRLRRGG